MNAGLGFRPNAQGARCSNAVKSRPISLHRDLQAQQMRALHPSRRLEPQVLLALAQMWTCALTGGIGSGKSTVAAGFEQLAVPVLYADRIARETLAPHSPGLAQVISQFGAHLLDPQGALDRAALGKQVFSNPQKRQKLEAIVHPLVQARFAQQCVEYQQQGHALLVYEIPLVIESGRTLEFDQIISVLAPTATRIARVMARDKLSEALVRERMAAQASDRARVDAADFIVHNDTDLHALQHQIPALLSALKRRMAWHERDRAQT